MHPLAAIAFCLFSPVFLVVALLVFIVWLVCTLTCVGPLLQCCFKSCDEHTLHKIPPGITYVTTPRGYQLAVRFTTPQGELPPVAAESAKDEEKAILSGLRIDYGGAKRFPIIIPNGLAATMATIGTMHDDLVKAGFTVCSFDRLGVGMSDENKGDPPTVEECVADCLCVMDNVMPENTQWLMLGPSMGAIVATCFIAKHPQRVVGFLNMDGIPHPFAAPKIREKFLGYRKIYQCWSSCVWTGFMRCGVCCGASSMKRFASAAFPVSFIKAQMNKSNFWRNTGLEFPLMMDCCAATSDAWGAHSVLNLNQQEVIALARVSPTQNGLFENEEWQTLPRSSAELGSGWATVAETEELQADLKTKAASPLSCAFANMVVRVMQARDYDVMGYDDEMKRMQAAEGSLQMLMAADGARYTFPTLKHGDMFKQVGAIVRCMADIDALCTARLRKSP